MYYELGGFMDIPTGEPYINPLSLHCKSRFLLMNA